MTSSHASSQEQEPLLARGDRVRDGTSTVQSQASSHHVRVLVFGYISMFFLTLYPSIFHTALTQTMEGNICQILHPNVTNPVADLRCKDAEVQAELSLVLGLESTFGLLPTLLFSIPYGMAADVYGRKPIVILSAMGCTLYNLTAMVVCRFPNIFPSRLLWAVPLTSVVGGGSAIALTILYAMANDVVSKSQRSMTFLLLTTSRLVAVLVSGPITYATLSRGQWLTFAVSMLVQFLGLLMSLLLPETLTLCNDEAIGRQKTARSFVSVIRTRTKSLVTEALPPLKGVIWGNRKLCLLLSSMFFAHTSKTMAASMYAQYATKRYGISWGEADLIISLRSFVMLGLFLCILPLTNYLVLRAGIPPIRQDSWTARIGVTLIIVSSWMTGLAETLPVFIVAVVLSAFSLCLEPAMRSLIVYSARNAGTGMVFSVMELLQALGFIASGPIVASSFRLGLHWGGQWLGLPLLMAACMAMPGAVIIFALRTEETEDEEEEVA
ncbi:Major facilitator superfamily domain, general substrate transporter, partial [Metarhizium majus ARSEF 297]